jgi:hypothetical protein
LILIEGPDGGGKSTLCEYLSERLGLPLSPASQLSKKERNDAEFRSEEAVRERVYEGIFKMVGGAYKPEIHDRLFISELIYSDVFGRDPAFTWMESRHIFRLMVACEIPVIFCIPPFQEVKKTVGGTDQMEGALDNLMKIYNHYVMMAKFMHRKKIKGVTNRGRPFDYAYPQVTLYDYTKPSHQEKVLKVCSDYVIKRKKRGGGWYDDKPERTSREHA